MASMKPESSMWRDPQLNHVDKCLNTRNVNDNQRKLHFLRNRNVRLKCWMYGWLLGLVKTNGARMFYFYRIHFCVSAFVFEESLLTKIFSNSAGVVDTECLQEVIALAVIGGFEGYVEGGCAAVCEECVWIKNL